jgi:hypothetical protein
MEKDELGGTYIEMDKFLEITADYCLVDYDGYGVLVRKTARGMMLQEEIKPSDIDEKYSVKTLRERYDGVWWFSSDKGDKNG